jgi:hypothetical protein
MALTKQKIVILVIVGDALLITLPFVAVDVLTHYYRSHGMPVPHHWWFVPISMGAGMFIFISLVVHNISQSVKRYFDKHSNKKTP